MAVRNKSYACVSSREVVDQRDEDEDGDAERERERGRERERSADCG